MAFSYYNINTQKGAITSNLRAIETVSGISYNTLTSWFRNGTNVKVTDNFIILKSELIKGRQQPPLKIEEPKQSSNRPEAEPEDFADEFDQLLK